MKSEEEYKRKYGVWSEYYFKRDQLLSEYEGRKIGIDEFLQRFRDEVHPIRERISITIKNLAEIMDSDN